MVIRTLLVDDHQIVREGLRALLDSESEIDVVGEASNGREALSMIRALSPQVVVMDVEMPEMDGIEATKEIEAQFDDVRVVALSTHSDKEHVSSMLDAGASAYVPKMDAHAELVRAVKAVGAGQHYLSPEIAGHVIDRMRDEGSGTGESLLARLTDREREVLRHLAEGRSSAATGRLMNISVKTVETHRHNIVRKVDVHGTAELTKFAIREGLASLEP